MHHYQEAITNNKGDALTGYYVKAVDATTGSTATLYADTSLTPIASISGLADTAKVDSDGNVSFYVAVGTYHLDIYATDATTLVKRIQNVPMNIDMDTAAAAAASQAAAAASATAADASATAAEAAYQSIASTANAIAHAATRSALAMLGSSVGPVYLREAGREGTFVFDSSNLSAKVTADTAQGIYVPPTSDTTGASGAWVRKFDGAIQASWFGAVGDGITDDGAALAAIGAFITYQGGGTVEFTRNAIYLFDGAQTYHATPSWTYYSWPPVRQYIIEIANCTKPVIIRLNGAILKNTGGYYGSINSSGAPNGNSAPYTGNTAATPYYAMIYIHDCTGGGYIENGTLDGNIGNVVVGSSWGDTGIQLPMDGAFLANNLPAIEMHRVYAHHNGRDAFQYDGPATSDAAASEGMRFVRCRAANNGRDSLSVVGGKGGRLESCRFWQAGKNCTGSNAASVASNPGAGIDFEAEGGKVIRDWVVDKTTEIYDNVGYGIVAQNGDVANIEIQGKIVGTTNYALSPSKPRITCNGATIVGTVTVIYSDANASDDCFKAYNTLFSTSSSRSPTGTVYVLNGHLLEGGISGNDYYNCTFEKGDVSTGGSGNTDGPRYVDCSFIANAGALSVYGRFGGHCRFIANGGTIGTTPGAVVGSDAGSSEGVWSYISGGTTTRYGPTLTASGSPLSLDSSNSSAAHIALKDAGVVRSYIATGGSGGPGIDFSILNADGASAANIYTAANGRRFEVIGGLCGVTAATRNGITTGWQAFYDAANGGIFSGGGSSYDVSLQNKNGTTFLRNPTGTQNVEILGSLGYGTGAGGTITQATSKSTGVTLNKICGQIVMNAEALAANASVAFTLTNSQIAATDTVLVTIASGATTNSYLTQVEATAAGSCQIQLRNISAGSLSEAVVLNFAVIKAVTA